VDGRDRERAPTTSGRRSGLRRRDGHRHAISPTLVIFIFLVVVASGEDHPPLSTTSEDAVETPRRRPTTNRATDAVDGRSVEPRTSEDNMRHNEMRIADSSMNRENDIEQSVSSSLITYMFLYRDY